MPFCGSCGAVIAAGEAFCGECGAPAPVATKAAGGSKSEEDRIMRTMNKFAPSLAAPSPTKGNSPQTTPTHSSHSGSFSSPNKPSGGSSNTSPAKVSSTPSASHASSASAPKASPAPSNTSSSSHSSSGGSSIFCPECGSKVSAAGKFCSECGYTLSGSVPSSSAPSSSAPSSSHSSSSHSSNTAPASSAPSNPAPKSEPSPSRSSGPSASVTFVDGAPKCHKCGQDINGGAYEFQGSSYHEPCWRCEGCGGNLNGVPFGLLNGSPWCKGCNFGRPKVTCPTCNQLVSEGAYTQALGNTYHVGCFKCSQCNAPIGKASGGFFEKGGRVVCKSCN